MPLALQKSTNGGATFEQVSLSVADYTMGGHDNLIANRFLSIKDSQNNTYILCLYSGSIYGNETVPLIKISNTGIKTVVKLTNLGGYRSVYSDKMKLSLSRDESLLFCCFDWTNPGAIFTIKTDMSSTTATSLDIGSQSRFAIYKDQYIWVASGNTVKIYDYDTKAELASKIISGPAGTNYSINAVACGNENNLYVSLNATGGWHEGYSILVKLLFNGTNTISVIQLSQSSNFSANCKQLLIDRFGDLIILTNSGTASTLLKYSNTGTLIDTVNLSVGTNKGAYGLQVYSKDNGTKCWVQFSNDLGTWRSAETTAQGQVFGVVRKIRDNGVTVYGDDHGGDNNYSVRC